MTGAIELDADDPQEAPLETEGVGEDPGSVPGNEPAIDTVGPDDSEADLHDGEARQSLTGADES